MCDCATPLGDAGTPWPWYVLPTPVGPSILAQFDAGRLTSDGGLLWLARADAARGLAAALARCIPEWRRGRVRHTLPTLLRQRIFQIACGYADQDDADHLRTDPLLKLACGRSPERGADLAGQPTLSRLEDAVDRWVVERVATALVAIHLRERGRAGAPTHVRRDPDGTDDPAHGHQEGVGYHGYYRQYMDFPLLIFDGDTGRLVTAILRPGRIHGSRFAVLVLRRLLTQLRAAWPNATVELRADSGLAVPRLSAWCEANRVTCTIGLIPNPVLEAYAAPLLAEAQAQSRAQDGAKVRLADEAQHQAGSWPHERRVVFKAEVLAEGPNTRFVVTTRTDPPLAVHDHYVDRGEPENWIKDLKNGLQADRLSDRRSWANACRLLLHAAAYWLLDTLRRWLAAAHAEAAHLQLDTLRPRVLKLGGWVREVADRYGPRLCLHLSSHHPGLALWNLLARPSRLPARPP